MGDDEGEHEAAALIGDIGLRRCECESEIWTSCSDTRPAHAHNTSWSNIDRAYTQPGLLRSFVPLYVAGSKLCLQKALYFMTLTPPPKAKLSNKAPLQGPLGPCLPPRSSGSSVVGLEVSSGAQNPVTLFIFTQLKYKTSHFSTKYVFGYP